ncbi:MAG: tetratricopeptide repeat protein [Bacteroidaceae bacterium]|nr:tetratricopeptide repeat protein [Bacteroidaceae bacterium]
MDYKAFKKISGETEEAFAERRFFDVLSLITAINKDCSERDYSSSLLRLRQSYQELLAMQFGDTPLSEEKAERNLNQLFGKAINLFTEVRFCWLIEHKPTTVDRMTASLLREFEDKHITEQMNILRLYPEGATLDAPFFEALDAAFGLIWCILELQPQTYATLSELLCSLNRFARRTLVSSLLMNELQHFNLPHLDLLLKLAEHTNQYLDILGTEEAMADEDNVIPREELRDLQARIAVGLTLIVRRYSIFLQYLPAYSQRIHDSLAAPAFREELPELLRAIVNQSLTDRVDKRVDDILPIIKDAFEKQQPHLGSSDDEETDDPSSPKFKVEVRAIRIDGKEGRRLFRKMADYARRVDELRQNEMDVNASNMKFMKRFDFFNHPAHWFYPFTTEYPALHDGLYRNEKPNPLTLSIMNSSRFCDSDRFSYASMMLFLHKNRADSITGQLQDQIDQFRDEDDEDEDFGAGHHDFDAGFSFNDDDVEFDFHERQLPPLFNYCQSLYRFFTHTGDNSPYPDAFTLQNNTLLPCEPFFSDLFAGYQHIEYAAEALLNMGASREAIILCNHAAENFGTNAHLLQVRGMAYMHQQTWRMALSDFQQAQLFDEDPEITLYMARCYEALQEWEDALPLLRQELERQADDASPDSIEELARCHIQMKQWDEAASLFFRLEFMERHLTVAQRGIAWCSLHQGKFERAEQYYRQLIDDKKHTSWEDRINLGHALWLQGKRAEALQTYRQFVTRFNRTKKDQRAHFAHWTEAFQEDARNLLQPHFSAIDIALMLDAITQK